MADLNIGNSSASVVVNAKHNGSVTPQINNTYDLGTSDLRWKNIYGSLKGNADTATTATNLAAAGTWTWVNGTTAGPTANLVLGGKTTSIGAIPSASSSASGVITTGTQTIAGEKTFISNLLIKRNTPNLYITDTNTGVKTFSAIHFGSTNASGTTNETAASIFLNGPQRADDGGANLMTIRNNVGDLRLNNNVINTGKLTIGQATQNASYTLTANGTSYFSDNISIKAGKEIRTVGTKATSSMIRFLDNISDASGNGISIGGGGVTVLGAGESASSFSTSAGTENLYLLADSAINIEANAGTIADRIGFQINTNGNLLPVKAEAGNNSAQDIGSYDYRIRDIYANTLRLRTAASNPSQTAGARLEFSYYNSSTDLGQPIFLHYCPNDSYRAPAGLKIFGGSEASPAWLEVEGNIYAPTFHGVLDGNAATATNADKLDNLHAGDFVRAYNTTPDNIDADWGQSFKTFDPIPSGTPPEQNPNISLLSIGNDWNRRKMFAFMYDSDNIYYRRKTNNNFSAWVKLLHNGNYNSYAPTLTGGGASGTWNISINGGAKYLNSYGNTSQENGRTAARGGVYTYNMYNETANGAPEAYLSVIGFGLGTNGHVEIAGHWCSNTGLWYRSLRDWQDNWYPWNRIWVAGNSVTSAVWNDYAEYREADTIQGGRCVREVGDDTLTLTTKRLMRGCSITSDTWGFAQGETEKAKTPIAVAGRVLAYPLEDRELFKEYIGYSVCSGPDGTVSLMTEEEELKYPWAIIGTVSAVPDYEEWGGGEMADRPSVKVDGRIWIKVR